MSTRSARRRATNRLAQTKRHAAFVLTAVMPSIFAPPDFGPQNGGDDIRTVRVIKDVLPVGNHKLDYDENGNPVFWNVTQATLKQILADFNVMKSRGVGANLGKTHGDADLLIHPDDLIAPIDELKIADNTLWMSCYVTPEEALYLANPARKVSIAVIPDHEDGAGHVYRLYLSHVAITDRPVVAGQSPFMALADGAPSGGKSMDFPALLEAINGLLEALGFAALPDDTSEENIVDRLIGVRAAMGTTAETTTTETTTEPGGEAMPELDMGGLPPALRDPIRKVLGDFAKSAKAELKTRDEQIKTLSDELTARKTKAVLDAKAAFDAECVRAMTVPDSRKMVASRAVVDEAKKLADRLGTHDLGLLKNISRTVKLDGSAAKENATAEPPPIVSLADAVSSVTSEEAREASAKRTAARLNMTIEQARKHLPRLGS